MNEPWMAPSSSNCGRIDPYRDALLFAALGGLLSERGGTFAVGTEGTMLSGAFGGAVRVPAGKYRGRSHVSAASGALIGFIVAVATAKFRADHMVIGLAVNILALGLTSFLLRGMFQGRAPVIQLQTIGVAPLPYLADLPWVGPVLFRQPLLTYAALLLTLATSIFLMKTRRGLTLRAVGESRRPPLRLEQTQFACAWGRL